MEMKAENESKPTARRLATFEDRYMHRSFNYAASLTDEIALEGLDGITLQALWLRLEQRRGFNLSINDTSKNTFWESMKRTRFLEFFELPVPRPDLVYYDRSDFADERGNTYEPLSAPEDIYLYAPIDDVSRGIRGSCPYYKERRDVGTFVRKLTLANVTETYGNKLVIVAHQDLRDKILFQNSFMESKEVSIVQYCILERVGRSRYHGESTRGHISLSVLKMDAKSLFYHRKILIAKQLVTKQAFSMKFGPNRLSSLITIFHLPRFYVLYKSNQVRNVERLFNELQRSESKSKELAFLKHQYGKNLVKIVIEDYSDVFEVEEECMAILHPEKLLALKDRSKVDNFGKRQLKIVRLRNPDMNFTTYLTQKAATKEDEEDPESAEKDIFVVDEVKCQTSVLINCWKYFIQKYTEGCTVAELVDKFNMFLLDARAAARFASKLNLVVSFVEDAKKTKFQRFVYFKCSEANQIIRHLTTSLPTEKVVGVGSARFYKALDRVRFDATEFHHDASAVEPCPLVPIVEMSEKAHSHSLVPTSTASSSNVDDEPNEILPLEDNIRNRNKLTMPSTSGGSSLPTFLRPGEGVKTKAQSTVGEKLVFVPVKYVDTLDEDGTLISRFEPSPFTYEGLFGFQISIELAEINPQVIRETSFLVNSVKTVRRVKYILDLITSTRFFSGSSSLLQEIRTHEIEVDGISDAKMDRMSLFRILKELHKDKRIQIWRITLVLDNLLRKVIVGFTPPDTLINSPHLLEGVNSLIRWLHFKFVRPSRPKMRNIALKKIKIHKAAQRRLKKEKQEGGEPIRKTKRVRKKPKPIRPTAMSRYIYDEEDIAARARMKRQRSHWTPIEDASLMYVFIASVLFFPRYKLGRLVMYNSTQLRDVLHRKVKETRTKTAVSIRRRFHFLIKRPEIYGKLRQNLAIAIRDRDLKIYIKDKYEPAALSAVNQSFAQVSVEGLSEVFDYLREKFEFGFVQRTNVIVMYADTIPESKKRKFDIAQEIESKRPKFSEFEIDPLAIGEFDVTSEDYTPLEFATALMPKTNRIIENGYETEDHFDLKLIAAKTMLFSLLLSGHPTEIVIGVVDRMDESVLNEALNYLRDQTIITVTKLLRFTLALPMKRRLQSFLTPPMYNYSARVLQRLYQAQRMNATRVATISSLYMLTEMCALATSSNLADIHVDMPVNVVDFNKEWKNILTTPGSTQSQKQGPEPYTSSASGTLDSGAVTSGDDLGETMDGPSTELNLRDFKSRFIKTLGLASDQVATPTIFNLTLPHIHSRFKGFVPTFESELPSGVELVALMRNHLIETVPSAEDLKDFNIPSDLLSITKAIYATREKGVMILTLKKIFDRTVLISALKYLLSVRLAFIVGNDVCKLVGVPFIKLWSSIPANVLGWQSLRPRIIARPWITCTGEINWQLVDQLLCSLIGQVELNPGATVRQIASSLVPLISAVDGIVLLKMMHQLKLVNLFEVTTPLSSQSLFEDRRECSSASADEDNDTCLLQFEELFIQVAEFYTLKYCTLKRRLQEELGKEAFATKSSTSFTAIDPKRRADPRPSPTAKSKKAKMKKEIPSKNA